MPQGKVFTVKDAIEWIVADQLAHPFTGTSRNDLGIIIGAVYDFEHRVMLSSLLARIALCKKEGIDVNNDLELLWYEQKFAKVGFPGIVKRDQEPKFIQVG